MASVATTRMRLNGKNAAVPLLSSYSLMQVLESYLLLTLEEGSRDGVAPPCGKHLEEHHAVGQQVEQSQQGSNSRVWCR